MRILSLAIVVSAVVHAAVVAWLALRAPTPRRGDDTPAVTPVEIVTVEAPAVPPLDVQLPAPPTEPSPPPPRAEPAPQRAAAATARPTSEPPAQPATTAPPATAPDAPRPGPPGHHPLLAMRRGEVPSAALPFGRWDALDNAPRGTSPERPVPRSGQLHEAGGGTYRSDQGVFDATVRRDGSVEIHDAPNLRVHLALPTARALGHSLADWYESDKGASGKEGDTSMGKQIQVSAGSKTEPNTPGQGQPQDRTLTVIIPVLAGGFDITDWLMRNQKIDPYDRRKLAFLDATRDERVEIGKRGRAEQLAMTPQIVLRSLEAVWGATTDLAARKHALFELWDDCVEAGDPPVVEAAAAARRMIIGFIRARLPAGSEKAFTAAEIAALAKTQRSKAVFQPYE